MKKHILALAGLLAGAMMATSCSQARLDEVEHLGVTEVDKTYAEANDMTAQQLIANVYVTAKYLMMGDWGVHYIATTSAKTAECWPGGSGPNDGPEYHRMSAMIDDSENNAYKEMYTRFYKIMYKCNMIVDKLNDGSAERKRVIAEAKAWRAWAMMRLTQLWGSAPLVDHVLDGINYSFYPGNSNPEDNWKWIMTQFDEAAAVLPSKSGLGGQKAIGGRWTAEACYAYKGQGYMWQNDYANAKVELAKVINSGKYELWDKTATMGPSSYGTNMQLAKSQNENWSDGSEEYEYLTLYRAEADFCDEFLLELDIDGDMTTITSTEPYWFRAYMNWRKDEVNLPGNTTTASDGWGRSTGLWIAACSRSRTCCGRMLRPTRWPYWCACRRTRSPTMPARPIFPVRAGTGCPTSPGCWAASPTTCISPRRATCRSSTRGCVPGCLRASRASFR